MLLFCATGPLAGRCNPLTIIRVRFACNALSSLEGVAPVAGAGRQLNPENDNKYSSRN